MDIDEMASAILALALANEKKDHKTLKDEIKENIKYFNSIREKITSLEKPDGGPPQCPKNDPDCPHRTRKKVVNLIKLSLSRESFAKDNNVTGKIEKIIALVDMLYHTEGI